jgi:hypothetical protein
LNKIKRARRGGAVFRDIWGKPPESIVEEVLMNLYLAEAMRFAEVRKNETRD